MKIYQTENVLFYKKLKITMLDELRLLYEEHKERYGKYPRRILVSDAQWELYEEQLPEHIKRNYSSTGYPKLVKGNSGFISGRKGIVALSYRGIPVVKIDDWKELMK